MKAMRKLFRDRSADLADCCRHQYLGSIRGRRSGGRDSSSRRQPDSTGTEAKGHDPVASAQQRLARLKSNLAITAEQEPQWSAFSNTVLQQMEQFKAAHQGRKTPARTAPNDKDRQVAWMKERAAAFETVGSGRENPLCGTKPSSSSIFGG